jgi:phospholipase/lecithinase/hemolysin
VGGGLDYYALGNPDYEAAAANIATSVALLAEAGAKQIMVTTMPPAELYPGVVNCCGPYNPFGLTSEQLLDFVENFNAVLADEIRAVQCAQPDTLIYVFDMTESIRNMADNPEDYGFTNVTQPLRFSGGNDGEYLFWDTEHMTHQAHAFMASDAFDTLSERPRARAIGEMCE